MPTINAGSTFTTTIPAGTRFGMGRGTGTYRVGPVGSSASPTIEELIDPEGTWLGPFSGDCSLTVRATTAVTYNTVAPFDALTQTQVVASPEVAASLVSGAGIRRLTPSSRAIRGGQAGSQMSAIANSATFTYALTMQFDQPFDAIRPILMHCDPTPVPGVKFCVASNPNYAGDKLGNSLTWVQGTFAGSATGTLTAGTTARPTPLVGDLTPCPSVARSDGGSGYMAVVRVMIPTGGTLPLSTHSVADIGLWSGFANNAAYSDRWAGDGVTTPASYAAGGSRADSPIWGVEVLSRGRVISVIEFGDSITRGQGKSVNDCYSWGELAAQAATERAAGISVLNGNAGYSGQKTWEYLPRAQDLIPLLKPSIAVYPAFSPNDVTGGNPLTQSVLDAARYRTSVFVRLCQDNGVLPVLWTGLPAASAKTWNAASDNFRKAYNAELKATYAGIALVVDMDAAMSDGASPANIIAGKSGDGLHPNDSGYADMASAFKAQCLDPVMLASR